MTNSLNNSSSNKLSKEDKLKLKMDKLNLEDDSSHSNLVGGAKVSKSRTKKSSKSGSKKSSKKSSKSGSKKGSKKKSKSVSKKGSKKKSKSGSKKSSKLVSSDSMPKVKAKAKPKPKAKQTGGSCSSKSKD